jgi:SPP1 family predicted phage head-tail adaptor
MNVGQMNQQVTIQLGTATQDDYGSPVTTWSTVATVWASVLPNRRATDLERFLEATGRERQRTQYTLRLYFRADVTENNRLLWGAKPLDIKRVIDPDGRRQWLEIEAQEIEA